MNYYRTDERETIRQRIAHVPFNYAISITTYGKSVSAGDIWEQHRKAIARLLRNDKDISFSFFVCQSVAFDESQGVIHGHALLKTDLTEKEIKKCFSVWTDLHIDRLPTPEDVRGFTDYILQSSRNRVWRDAEHIRLPRRKRTKKSKRIAYEATTQPTGAPKCD